VCRANHPFPDSAESPLDRIMNLVQRYSDPRASTAYLLCDRHDPDAVAYTLVASDLSSVDLSFGTLRHESERLASALASLGLGAGDRIATLMGKTREYLVTVMAIWRLGAVHVPLFTAFAPPAIAFRALTAGCKLIVCDPTQQPKLAASNSIPANPPWRVVTTGQADHSTLVYADLLARGEPEYPAAVLGGYAPIIQIYTSGTTGTPKGVLVPLRAVAGFQAYAEYALDLRFDDVFWNAADPGWAYGLYFGIIAALSTGVRGILLDGGFEADKTLRVLSRFAVTNFTAAPTVYRSLRASSAVSQGRLRLRCATSAGEPLTADVNEWATKALGLAVHDHYGQTEAGMLINNHHHAALERSLKIGSMGCAAPGWHAVVLKADADTPATVGELGRVAMDLTRSPLAWFDGYVNDPARSAEKFSADGRWYLTGDVGHVDGEGGFYFSARDDDVIIMAGYRIGPFEVESVLATHPAVYECAVVAAPDDLRGEVLEAFIVLRAGIGSSDELTSELQDWVKRRYAAHAYPRRIHYAGSLPKTASGKIQRATLRQQLWGKSATDGHPP
jgi:acetyl-CoA synthetase